MRVTSLMARQRTCTASESHVSQCPYRPRFLVPALEEVLERRIDCLRR